MTWAQASQRKQLYFLKCVKSLLFVTSLKYFGVFAPNDTCRWMHVIQVDPFNSFVLTHLDNIWLLFLPCGGRLWTACQQWGVQGVVWQWRGRYERLRIRRSERPAAHSNSFKWRQKAGFYYYKLSHKYEKMNELTKQINDQENRFLKILLHK